LTFGWEEIVLKVMCSIFPPKANNYNFRRKYVR